MKPSTQERIDRVLLAVSEQDLAKLGAVILAVLKEQDSATRHACAEAVLSAVAPDPIMGKPAYITAILRRAHDAAMNAQSL